MKFSFNIGDKEHHKVDFNFSQMWGKLSVLVDGKEILSTLREFKSPFSTKDAPITFDIGINEKHKVSIQRTMSPIFAGFFPMKYEVYVDDKLINTYNGY